MYRLDALWQMSGRTWTNFWSRNDSNYLNAKLKVFKKDDNKEFRLLQNLTMGETDFNQFRRWRNQLVIAAENFAKGENLYPVLITSMSKDMDEQLKLAQKVLDVVDRANKKTCVIQTQYRVDELYSFYDQVRKFCKAEGEREFSTSCLCEFSTCGIFPFT